MSRLDDISMNDLQELRQETEGEVPRERVLAAIGRKQGDTLDRLAERHGVVEKTIRNWLDRFEELPLKEAPYDADRPGRPSKLTDEERKELFEALNQPPTEVGYNRQAWTSSLVKHHIETTYDVEYTARHIRDLMEETGLSWRTARPRHSDANEELEAEFQHTVQKNERS